MKRYITYFSCLLLFACEFSTDWELMPDVEERLVVEAILTDELKHQIIQLSTTYSNLNDTSITSVNNATVQVAANSVTYDFDLVDSKSGIYKSKIPFDVARNLDYELRIDWVDATYTAVSRLSTVAPLPQARFDTLTDSDLLILGDFVPLYNPSQQAMYQIDIDWSDLQADGLNRARLYRYTFSTTHISALLRTPQEITRFPKGSQVVMTKYGLNDDFADYLRAKAIETDWSGSFFYSTADNLPTNLSGDAFGFFSTCAVLRDTVIAE